MLTPEELEKLSGAETLFPSPIPVQFVSSDEYMPSPQSAKQKEFEARIKEMGSSLAKKHGMSRRKFFKTAGGMAAAFAAMNEVHAKGGQALYEVAKGETTSLDVAQARADSLKNQFVMDMHTHFLREGTPIMAFVAQREAVRQRPRRRLTRMSAIARPIDQKGIAIALGAEDGESFWQPRPSTGTDRLCWECRRFRRTIPASPWW